MECYSLIPRLDMGTGLVGWCAAFENHHDRKTIHSNAMRRNTATFAALVVLLSLSRTAHPTRIKGRWNYDPASNRLKYLAKFGVQDGHQVFTFGSSVRPRETHVGFTDTVILAFTPSSIWESFYNLEKNGRHSCEEFMAGPFNNTRSPDTRCSDPGDPDLYRVVPCDFQRVCMNQYGPVVPGSNLTFRPTAQQTQYYYLYLVGCRQNSTDNPCVWAASDGVTIDYDIHIVNQDPEMTLTPDPFIYEFSYDLIGTMIIYIIFSCIYFAVVVFHLVMHSHVCTPYGYKHHTITLIFSASLLLEFLHVALIMTHYSVFSTDGVGVRALFYIGQAANYFSDWLLILVLMLIGKGWQITTATVRWKKITVVMWVLYIVVSAIFFIWIVVRSSLVSLTVYGLNCHTIIHVCTCTSEAALRGDNVAPCHQIDRPS